MSDFVRDPNDPYPLSQDQALSEDQQLQALRWVETHWTKQDCPFHGPTTWQLESAMTGTPVLVTQQLFVGGPTFPYLVLLCMECGYSVFVNALTAGILPVVQPPERSGA